MNKSNVSKEQEIDPRDLPFDYELYQGFKAVRIKYLECEREHHLQQVMISTHLDGITQVCHTEGIVRTTVDSRALRSIAPHD